MTSTAIITTLRELLADIERGKASSMLRNPVLVGCLRLALGEYAENMAAWHRLSRLLEQIERSVAWDASADMWVLTERRMAEYHSALAQLRNVLEARR